MCKYILETTSQGIILGTLFPIRTQPCCSTPSPAWQALAEENQTSGKTHISFPGGDSQPCVWLQPGVSFQHWELLSEGCWRTRLKRGGSHEQWQGPPDVALGSGLPVGHLQQNPPTFDTWCSRRLGPLGVALLGCLLREQIQNLPPKSALLGLG